MEREDVSTGAVSGSVKKWVGRREVEGQKFQVPAESLAKGLATGRL
jgi:hypothetical protein